MHRRPSLIPVRFALISFTAAGIVAAVLGLASWLALGTQVRDIARSHADKESLIAHIAVRENAQRLTDVLEAYTSSRVLSRAVRQQDDAAIEELLETLHEQNEGVRVAFFVRNDGTATHMYPLDRSVLGKAYTDRDWYRGVRRQSPYLSEVYEIAAFDQPRAITVAATVPGPSGKPIGIITAVQEASYFDEALDELEDVESSEVAIIDQRGALVAATDPHDRALARARRDARSDARGRFSLGDASYVYRAVDVGDGSGWQVVSVVSEQSVAPGLVSLRRGALVFILLEGLALLAVGWVVWRVMRAAQLERILASERRRAFEINDGIVQRLAAAELALTLGKHDEAAAATRSALREAKELVDELVIEDPSYVRRVTSARDGGDT